MKRRMFGAVLGVLLAAPVFAQDQLSADIPFAFHVNGTTLAAGAYHLVRTSPVERVWSIREASGQPGVLFSSPIAAETIYARKTGALVFHRYGNRYFLSELRVAGETLSWRLLPSKAEREYVRARTPVETASVVLTTDHAR